MTIDLSNSFYGILSIILFVAAYAFVPFENIIHLRKSKPIVLAACIIWGLVAVAYAAAGDNHTAEEAVKHNLLEYVEIFLFILSAMTYINVMEERNVFQALKSAIVARGFTLYSVFWITGILAFLISAFADNLTTALLLGAVVITVGGDNNKFISIACVSVVIAANAGGAFTPFGDITSLMVWQKGKVDFFQFFYIFIPALVNWFVPALIMSFFVERKLPEIQTVNVKLKNGALIVVFLFILTIISAICANNFLHIPPVTGMMFGLGLLGFFTYFIKRIEGRLLDYDAMLGARDADNIHPLFVLNERMLTLSKSIEQLPVAAFSIDNNHTVTRWNASCEKLTGIKASEIIGTKNHSKAFYSENRPLMLDLIADKAPDSEYNKYYKTKYRKNSTIDSAFDGIDFFSSVGKSGEWLLFSAMPLKDITGNCAGAIETLQVYVPDSSSTGSIDMMKNVARAEWDTLLFFYGVILCVGGLAQFGYLSIISNLLYTQLGPTTANFSIGILSAIIDNIPIMYAVLTMNPDMSLGQWLLVTFTAGVGGSLLAIGSAAGVGLLGTSRGKYTFFNHLRWTPAIFLGYLLSILVHLYLNAHLM